MARRTRARIAELLLEPEAFALREGAALGDLPRQPSAAAVRWEICTPSARRGDALQGAAWATDGGPVRARAVVAISGAGYVTDAAAGAERVASTPLLAASALAAWTAIELLFDAPDSTTSARFRLTDDGSDYYWDGAAWAVASTTAHWSTAAEVEGNFSSWPIARRAVRVRCRLSTTSALYSPAFFGCRVGYETVEPGDLDDALRTILVSLQTELAVRGEWWVQTSGSTSAIAVAAELSRTITGVDAVYNLTADPDRTSPLSGSYAGGTWTADVPIAGGQKVAVEHSYTPAVLVRRHRDLSRAQALPAVLLTPSGPPLTETGTGQLAVASRAASPPAVRAVPAPSWARQGVEVAVLAEFERDVHTIAAALRAWLGGARQRRLLSPSTGAPIAVQQDAAITLAAGSLRSGEGLMAEGTWRVSHPLLEAAAFTTTTLLQAAGLTLTLSAGGQTTTITE